MLPRSDVQAGFAPDLNTLAELIRSLDDAALARPTRCEGWTVSDVAAHVAGSMADVVAGRLEGAGSAEWTARQVEERRGRPANELADEVAGSAKVADDLLAAFDDEAWAGPAPAGVTGTLGDGVLALWYDAYLHADDIRAAVGLASVRGAGLRASVVHVADVLTTREWGPATLALDGLEEITIGGGSKERRITGDPLAFVLAATGRAEPTTVGLGPDVNIYAPV